MYTKKVIEYFQKPKNQGRMKNPDGIGKVGNPICGDVLWLYIKISKNKQKKDIIKDIKFETFGCVAAIATSSAITDLAKGKTIEEAAKINKGAIVKSLGGLPPVKIHCSILAADALFDAIYDYLFKNKKSIPRNIKDKHEKNIEEKKNIKKRYKKWVKIEEKIYDRKK